MLKFGLTGGIGSGKSTVVKVFRALGVDVYISDAEAKKFLFSEKIITKLRNRFGENIFDDNKLNKTKLANIVFNNADELDWLNSQIHPLVAIDFEKWLKDKQHKAYVIQESAILFESGFSKKFDKIITVSANKEERIERVMKRDNISKQEIKARMQKQLSDKEREESSDFIINNNDSDSILDQILEIHNKFK